MIEDSKKRFIHLLIALNEAFFKGRLAAHIPTGMRLHAIAIRNSCCRNLPHLSNFVILLLETLVRQRKHNWHALR